MEGKLEVKIEQNRERKLVLLNIGYNRKVYQEF